MKIFGLGVVLLWGMAGCATTAPDVDFDERIGKAVSSQEKEFRACYRRHGDKRNVATTVNYRLNYAGEIQFAEIDAARSEGSSPAMGDCMLAAFKTLKLPEIQGYDAARGAYTFHYSTE